MRRSALGRAAKCGAHAALHRGLQASEGMPAAPGRTSKATSTKEGRTGGGAPSPSTHMIQPTMPAKLTSGSVSTTSNTPRQAPLRCRLLYSGMKSVECTRQRCKQEQSGGGGEALGVALRQGKRRLGTPRCTLQLHAPAAAAARTAVATAHRHQAAHLRLCCPQVHVLVITLHVVGHLGLAAREHAAHCTTARGGEGRRRVERSHGQRGATGSEARRCRRRKNRPRCAPAPICCGLDESVENLYLQDMQRNSARRSPTPLME